MKKIHSDENAFGFIESLVAIVVGGVACIALLSVAAAVVREANNNEIRDAMNMHAIDGIESVRTLAEREFDTVPCDPNNPTVPQRAWINNSGHIEFVDAATGHCTENASEGDGLCEKLSMPRRNDDFFYRELIFYAPNVASVQNGECYKVRVEVHVGLLQNIPGWGAPNSAITEKVIEGYVAK